MGHLSTNVAILFGQWQLDWIVCCTVSYRVDHRPIPCEGSALDLSIDRSIEWAMDDKLISPVRCTQHAIIINWTGMQADISLVKVQCRLGVGGR